LLYFVHSNRKVNELTILDHTEPHS